MGSEPRAQNPGSRTQNPGPRPDSQCPISDFRCPKSDVRKRASITSTITNFDYDYEHEPLTLNPQPSTLNSHQRVETSTGPGVEGHNGAVGTMEVPRAGASGARGPPPQPAGAATPCHHGDGSACHATWCVVADPAAMGGPLAEQALKQHGQSGRAPGVRRVGWPFAPLAAARGTSGGPAGRSCPGEGRMNR